jgi:hypothetical protein
MPLSFPLYDLWDLVFVALVHNYATGMGSIRHHDISYMVKRLDVQLSRGPVDGGADSPFGVLGNLRHAKQDFIGGWRRAAVPSQAELRPAGSDEKIVAESRINTASKYGVARRANAVSREGSANRERKYMLLAAGALLKAEDASHR